MLTEAQKRAKNKYQREHVKTFTLRFFPNGEDEELYAWLKAQPKMAQYVKQLIKSDMDSRK